MTPNDEALAIIKRIGPVVLSVAVDPTTNEAATLRRMVGMMVVDENMAHPATFGTVFGMVLDLARRCDATLATMDKVRVAALAEVPYSLPAVTTVLAIVRLTLAAEARIIAAMTFRSRDDVDALAKVVNEAFSQTELVAADDLNADVYMALLRLHGDITQHLADSGRVLPRVISYKYQMVMPSLRMAQLAYADPTRSSDLEYENAVVQPAFMPLSGRMLAV